LNTAHPSRAAHTDKPEGFEIPLSLSLTQPVLMAGVPRSVAILSGTVTAALSLGLQVWWIGIPLGLAMHAMAVALTKADPLWLEVFRRQIRLPAHLEG
jgi:type IV secretion system protein VirB3